MEMESGSWSRKNKVVRLNFALSWINSFYQETGCEEPGRGGAGIGHGVYGRPSVFLLEKVYMKILSIDCISILKQNMTSEMWEVFHVSASDGLSNLTCLPLSPCYNSFRSQCDLVKHNFPWNKRTLSVGLWLLVFFYFGALLIKKSDSAPLPTLTPVCKISITPIPKYFHFTRLLFRKEKLPYVIHFFNLSSNDPWWRIRGLQDFYLKDFFRLSGLVFHGMRLQSDFNELKFLTFRMPMAA